MNIIQKTIESDIGPLHLVASARGLQGVFWKKQPLPDASDVATAPDIAAILEMAQAELTEYFAGKRQSFDVPLDRSSYRTPFQERVWSELMRIPYGTTCSYKEIADRLQTGAVRAVGSANGKNPLSIIVPCHRVIASLGGLGGYAGGIDIKMHLLDLERRCRRDPL